MGTVAPKALSELTALLRPHLDETQMRLVTSSSQCSGAGQYLHVQPRSSHAAGSSDKPVPSKGLNLTYLPTFHVICTSDADTGCLLLKLMTFHGKVVTSFGGSEQQSSLTLEDTLEFFKLLDTARLCSGITLDPETLHKNKDSFRLRVSKYLIEQFEDRVVVRSRQCRFAIAGADPESDENEDEWPTCEECAAAQEHIESGAEDEPVEPQLPLENSYHSIFGSGEKADSSFEGLLHQYTPLMPAYYAAINNARAAAAANNANGPAANNGVNNGSEDDDLVDPDVLQPAITLQPVGKISGQLHNSDHQQQTPGVKDESFQATMAEIASLGLKSDPFVCGECEATFKTYFGLRKHVTTSGHESEYHPRCFICSKYFKRAVNLRMHYTSTHLNLRPYKCSECDFTSATSSSIILHCKSAHNIAAENIMTIDSEIKKLEEFEKRFGIICMQNRKRKSLKTIHIQGKESHNPVEESPDDGCGGPLKADLNHPELDFEHQQNFYNKMAANVVEPEVSISSLGGALTGGAVHHQPDVNDVKFDIVGGGEDEGGEAIDYNDLDPSQVNSDPFVCDVCEATAPTLVQMKKHVEMTNHMSGFFPRCFICLKSFKRLSNLRFHHSSTHLKLRPYKCCHCDYIGTAPSAVINHAKSLHQAEDDEYITIESEMNKLEAFEAKFGIIAMQKRKRKHDKTIPDMPVSAKLGKTSTGEAAVTLAAQPPASNPPMPKLIPAPLIRQQQTSVITAPPPEPEQPEIEDTEPGGADVVQNNLTGYFQNALFQEYLSNLKRMQNVTLLPLLQKALINNQGTDAGNALAAAAGLAANAGAEDVSSGGGGISKVAGGGGGLKPYAPRGGSYTPRRQGGMGDFDVDEANPMHINSDPFQCDECGETFNKPHLVRSHLEQTSHKSRTDAKCFVCQKRCSRLSNLRSHYSAVHFNLKPYKCALCDVTASNSSTILTHAKDVHNLETNRFITLESEILKLEEYERKFGIVCMQKRKRRTMQPVDEPQMAYQVHSVD